MNPYVSKISQLLVVSALKTLLILMVLNSGVVDSTESCRDAKLVKPQYFYNICSKMYLGVRGKQIVADFEIHHTLYTITRANSHGFLLYDPEAKMFLCWKQNKKRSSSRLVPKENPKNVSLCIFEDKPYTSSTYTAYTKYESEKYKNFVMSFKRNGMQRIMKRNGALRIGRKKKSCQEEAFLTYATSESYTNCSTIRNKFCDSLHKIRHHNKIMHNEIKHVCENKDDLQHHRRRNSM